MWKRLLPLFLLATAFLAVVPSPAFASTTNFTFTCTMDNSAPAQTMTMGITGGTGTSVSPPTEPCDGAGHTVTVTYTTLTGAQATATEPTDGATTRSRFAGAATVTTNTACGASTCPAFTIAKNYYELLQNFTMTPGSPSTWDANYGPFNVVGSVDATFLIQAGGSSTSGATLCSISLTSGAGASKCQGWVDYNRYFTFVNAFASTAHVPHLWGANHTSYTPVIASSGPAGVYGSAGTTGNAAFTVTYSIVNRISPLNETISLVMNVGSNLYHAVSEIISLLMQTGTSHYQAVPSESIFQICGNHTTGTTLCSIQPVQFIPSGVTTQTVTFTGCGITGFTVLGDGLVHSFEPQGNCLLTATLPVGYVWTDTNTATATHTVCSSGTCTTWTKTYGLIGIAGTTLVVACNFFQLQCWAFHLMWMGMYESFFIGVALGFRVSEKAFIYLILAGATYASLVEISLGIMTPAVPIALIVLNVAYSFRLDRLVRGSP